MPIRIKLFLTILGLSCVSIFFILTTLPNFPEVLLTPAGTSTLLTLFMVVVLITFISLMMAIHFTLPLSILNEITHKVQSGDFSSRAYLTEKNEFGSLALSFNNMLDALEKNQTHLQRTVADATTSLAIKVKDLEVGKARDEAILLCIGDGLVVTDENGKIKLVNKAFTTILGWNEKEIKGQLFTEIVPLFNDKNILVSSEDRLITKTLKQRATYTNNDNNYQTKNKTLIPVSISVSPILVGSKLIGAVEIFADITKIKAVDKDKSEFVSLASHQLRTPLGIIKWYLESLKQEDYFKKSPHIILGYFEEIYKNNERVLSLVRELLSVSRIDQGRVKDAPKLVDLVAVVTEIIEQMKIMASKKKVALHLTIPDSKIPLIKIDILRLHEVIENLIVNAIEYTNPGAVDVCIKKSDESILLSVKDNGIGISPVDKKKLFTKFFRSEKATSRNPEGSGLGLYVVKSYVEGWGGKISVQSVEGKGTKIEISLPIQIQEPKHT